MIFLMFSFSKAPSQNVFLPHQNEKPAFLNSLGLKRVIEKLRFRDGLVIGLTEEIKLRFQISPAWCGRELNESPT